MRIKPNSNTKEQIINEYYFTESFLDSNGFYFKDIK